MHDISEESNKNNDCTNPLTGGQTIPKKDDGKQNGEEFPGRCDQGI
jgi:hypothetical protein